MCPINFNKRKTKAKGTAFSNNNWSGLKILFFLFSVFICLPKTRTLNKTDLSQMLHKNHHKPQIGDIYHST